MKYDIQREKERNRRMRADLDRRMGEANHPLFRKEREKALKTPVEYNKKLIGSIGDLGKVIWPFWFTFTSPQLAPNTGSNAFVTTTLEAAFVLMKMTQVVFTRVANVAPNYTYNAINTNSANEALNSAHDLQMSLRDAQSSRVFFGTAQEIGFIGNGQFPTIFPTPQLFLPNSTIECVYQNNHASNTYVPFITMFGYRVRIDDADELLSTITG